LRGAIGTDHREASPTKFNRSSHRGQHISTRGSRQWPRQARPLTASRAAAGLSPYFELTATPFGVSTAQRASTATTVRLRRPVARSLRGEKLRRLGFDSRRIEPDDAVADDTSLDRARLAAPVGRLDAKRPRGFNVLRPRKVTSSQPRAKTVLAARQCRAASMSRRILPPGLTRAIEP